GSLSARGREGGFMDINRFTEKAQQAILAARDLAARFGQQQIEPEHLLAALLDQDGGVVPAILSKAGLDSKNLRDRLAREIQRLPKVSGAGDQPHPSSRFNRIVTAAEDEARQFKDDFVAVEHLLLALLDDTGAVRRLLADSGATRDRIMSALREVR